MSKSNRTKNPGNTMKLTDFVIHFLAKEGITHIFGLTGGAVVHFFDSADKNPDITSIFTQHEQAVAFAAEAYARIHNDIGAAIVTTGPGGTNAITGVLAAWMDSIPCVFISGQSRIEHTSRGTPLRQIGSQEFDIISLVSHITKYAVMVDDPLKIKYYLQKAVYTARQGRPGPVWIDIPLNFQWISLDIEQLSGFDPSLVKEDPDKEALEECLKLIKGARRPLVLAGYGIRLAHAENEFKKFVEIYKIPFVSSWNASDLLPTKNIFYIGRIGVAGQRGANLVIQNCDLLLALGSHLCINLTSANFNTFAREAKKVVVDIDAIELANCKIKLDLPIRCDVKKFFKELLKMWDRDASMEYCDSWKKKCLKYKSYNAVLPQWRRQKKYVNPYVFVDELSRLLGRNDIIVVDGGGTALYMSFQGLRIKEGQRLIVSSGIASMGTGLPESIGACFAGKCKRTICLTGDGSIQLNIQELQTIKYHNLPIKIFVFNNEGYLAIRHTQGDFLNGRFIGSHKTGGVSLPDYQKIAKAYGLKAVRIYKNDELPVKIKSVLAQRCPVLCEVMISPEQELIPRMAFKKNPDGLSLSVPLEDMAPFMDRKEFLENMIVRPWTA